MREERGREREGRGERGGQRWKEGRREGYRIPITSKARKQTDKEAPR